MDARLSNPAAWPFGNGEMAGLIRGFDWGSTALGPASGWPGALRSAVGMMLDLGFPSYVWWGPDFVQLYNDAAIAINRAKHPSMLGRPGAIAWSDIWSTVGAFAHDVMSQGRAVLGEDLPLTVERGGPPAPAWFAFSYNPLRDEVGRVAGIFITAIETTARVLAERQTADAAARLRYTEDRYRTIFTSSGEAIALCEVIRDASGRTVDYRIIEANPSFDRMGAYFAAAGAGRTMSSLAGVVDAEMLEAVRQAFDEGAVRLDRTLPDPERWYETQIVPAPDNAEQRFIIVSSETTARRRAELALRRSQERQAFLLALSDAMRLLADPVEIQSVAARMLGEHLGASRVAYGDIIGDELSIEADYANGVDSLAGSHPLRDFGQAEVALWRSGHAVALAAVARAPELSASERRAYSRMGIAACIVAPLLRDGRLVGALSVHTAEPRAWTSDEVILVEDMAERIWMALQRVRAEQALQESEERLRIALEAGRMGTWRYDMRTGKQQWSRRQFEIFGLEPAAEPPSRALFLSRVVPEDLPRVEFTSDDVRPEGTFLDTEFRIVWPDGTRRHLIAHALARFDESGRPCEIIGINQDVTEQKNAEQALRDSEALLRGFAEASSDVLWVRSAGDMQWQFLSPAFETVYGLTREQVEGGDNLRSWIDLVVPEDRAAARDGLEKARAGENSTFEYRIRHGDGDIRWMRSTTFPMRNAEGKVESIGGIGHDLTELKRAEEHQRLLAAELQHRVRNTLAVIRAIARRTACSATSVDDYASHLEGRIDAFARVQAAVTRDPIGRVELATLVAEELRAYRAKEGDSLVVRGPSVRLRPKPAETVALAIHELATNAVKYGALSAPSGRLEIEWHLLEGSVPSLVLDWRETGVPDMPARPVRRGFGTEVLLQMLAYELGAMTTLDFLPTGIACHIVMPFDGAMFD